MRKIVSALLTVGLAATGLTAMSTVAAQAGPVPTSEAARLSYTPPPIRWRVCTGPYAANLKDAGARCGFLIVPVDYAHPRGPKLKLAVSVVRHKVRWRKYQGIVLVNPGGPGGSGRVYSIMQSWLPNRAGNYYDWVGFDPRGVGSSVPSLACNGGYFGYNRPDYVPTGTNGSQSAWLAKARGYSAACRNARGARTLLNHVRTIDTVRDMDSLRKAFHQRKINYYGFSYGTYLGQVYATVFPHRVRRMVWDGVVGWRGVWYRANLDQDVAFDRNINIWFGWIARNDATFHLGTTQRAVHDAWYAMLAQTRTAPLDGKIGPDEWTDAFLQAGYYVYNWNDLATAFAEAVNDKNYAAVTALYDNANGSGPGSDNGYAMYLGTQCTDVQWPTAWSRWQADNTRIYQQAPFETWANAWYNAPCLTWPGRPGRPVRVNGQRAPGILMIEETKDAATPWAGAMEARRTFPRSRLIEGVGGTTHAGSLSGVACTDNRIAAYFTSGRLPRRLPGMRSDVRCPPVPVDRAAMTSRMAAPGGLPPVLREALMAAQQHG